MARTRVKVENEEKVAEVGVATKKGPIWKHGQMIELPLEALEPNEWNPNELTADQFDMLSENIDEVGFLDPVLVVPLPLEDGDIQRYRIVDGEHRYEQQRLMDVKMIRCIIADPEKFDEKEQKRQTVRMNKIRGQLNIRKFAALANEMMEKHGVPFNDLAREFGFVDEDEFQEMIEAARDSLPDEDAKKEFDKAKSELKTVEDLTLLLNRLFTKYGDTVPYHFMVLDFGGKQHIWIRMDSKMYKHVKIIAREVQAEGVTFDSVVLRLLLEMDVQEYVKDRSDFLEKVDLSKTEDQQELLVWEK